MYYSCCINITPSTQPGHATWLLQHGRCMATRDPCCPTNTQCMLSAAYERHNNYNVCNNNYSNYINYTGYFQLKTGIHHVPVSFHSNHFNDAQDLLHSIMACQLQSQRRQGCTIEMLQGLSQVLSKIARNCGFLLRYSSMMS